MHTNMSRPTPPRYMEHRWGQRVDVDLPVRLVMHDGTCVQGTVRNASISGAFIATTMRPAPLTTLIVQLVAREDVQRRTLELPACVVRTARDGIAVEWRDMAVPTLVALLREAGASELLLRSRDRAFG